MSAEMSDEKTDLQEPATLQVTGEAEVKLDSPAEEKKEPSIQEPPEDRDPTHMNEYVKVQFHDIFAEPDTEVYSFNKIWATAYKVFTQTKIGCYRVTSVVLAVPFALCWGVYFACLSFCTVWCCIPYLKCTEIWLNCIKRLWDMACLSLIAPCCEAMGQCCYNIRVKMLKD